MKTQLIYNDSDYSTAINCEHTDYCNFPITANIEGKKFIIGSGTSDNLSIVERDNLVYIVGENHNLEYISLDLINTKDNTINSCFLNSIDINDPQCFSYGLLGKSTEDQIKVLSEYLQY